MNRSREGVAVLAYTATSVEEYKSLSEAARVYGLSRKKIQALIESGATHTDGVTTFDIPIMASDYITHCVMGRGVVMD